MLCGWLPSARARGRPRGQRRSAAALPRARLTPMSRIGLAAALALAASASTACAGSSADSARTSSTATGSETTVTIAAPTTIPAGPTGQCSGACTDGDRCEGAVAWSCGCTLHADVNCGGAQRALGPGWWAWSCTPLDGATDRGDGCPFAMPSEGAACRTPQQCRYAEGCGWNGTDATCDGHRWRLTTFMSPPPP